MESLWFQQRGKAKRPKGGQLDTNTHPFRARRRITASHSRCIAPAFLGCLMTREDFVCADLAFCTSEVALRLGAGRNLAFRILDLNLKKCRTSQCKVLAGVCGMWSKLCVGVGVGGKERGDVPTGRQKCTNTCTPFPHILFSVHL